MLLGHPYGIPKTWTRDLCIECNKVDHYKNVFLRIPNVIIVFKNNVTQLNYLDLLEDDVVGE